jgi:hypothetical protein
MGFLDGHEGSGDGINHFDDPLSKFLDWLDDENYVKIMFWIIH